MASRRRLGILIPALFWPALFWAIATAGRAQEAQPTTSGGQTPPPASAGATTLYLEVTINSWPTQLVARVRDDHGRLSLPGDQFEGLGFLLDEAWVTHEGDALWVDLDAVPDLTWRIDRQAQTLALTAPFARLNPTRIAVAPGPEYVKAASGRGLLLSYDLFGEWAQDPEAGSYGRSVSTVLDARLFTPRYTLASTGSVSHSLGVNRGIRYETFLANDNQEKARTWRFGDSVTRGLIWSRNLRFAGVQYQRNFSLRPDIVTAPLPEYADGVTTPSVLDLYVNGVKRYSQGVQPGAFALGQLPTLTGANQMTVVVTDVDGRERTVTLPFYVTTRLLGEGVTDFSVEAGAMRENYGVHSNDYGPQFASATWRRGISDAVTLEAHGEAAKGLWLAGVSGAFAVRSLFAFSVAAAVSDSPSGQGSLWSLGFDRTTQRLSLTARREMASDDFRDVPTLADQSHPKTRDVAAVGLNMGKAGTLNLAYVSEVRSDAVGAPVATASYGVDLFNHRARLSATAYNVLNEEDQWGVGISISVPLGGRGLVSAGLQKRKDAQYHELDVRGSALDDRLTWEVRDVESPIPVRSAELRWDGSTIDGRARLLNDGATSAVQVEAAQSFVIFDRRFYVADRVDEAFAVVQVGTTPGVEVFRENQPVGRTDRNGRLFVNHLRAYESNGLSVDPTALPLDAALETTAKTVAPRRGAGAAVNFSVVEERSALVTLMTAQGASPPAGAEVHLGDRVFPLGYGGEVYLRGLTPGRNVITVLWRDHACEVVVTVPAKLGGIPKLGPYSCTP